MNNTRAPTKPVGEIERGRKHTTRRGTFLCSLGRFFQRQGDVDDLFLEILLDLLQPPGLKAPYQLHPAHPEPLVRALVLRPPTQFVERQLHVGSVDPETLGTRR